MTSQKEPDALRELYRSLDERWRPEDVAQRVLGLLELAPSERCGLQTAAESGRQNYWSSMSSDFERPCDMSRQLKVAQELFGQPVQFAPNDVKKIEEWIVLAERLIGKTFGQNDFKQDRLPRAKRKEVGIDISRRQYNKRFRVAARLEKKVRKL